MEKAIKAVRDGTMSQNKASLLYKIPKGTLNARLHDKYKSNKFGRRPNRVQRLNFFSKHSKYNYKHDERSGFKYDPFGFKSD